MKKIALIIFSLVILFSCQKKLEEEEGRRVKVSILAPIRSLDPRFSHENTSKNIASMLYEGLMRLGPDGSIIPGVAESVAVSDDGLTYTFFLRDSLWSNGDPVTAYDFEHAWKKSVDPKYADTGASTFYPIKNVAACLSKEVGVNEVGIKALDKKTLEVELEHPAPYFLYLCACPTYSPIHKENDLEHQGWGNSFNPHFISNGPFCLKRWKKGVEIILEKNPLYWEAEDVRLAGIEVQVLEDPNTQFFLFEKGELDWVGQPFNPLPIDIVRNLEKDANLNFLPSCAVSWYFINTEKAPFNNKNLRKALAYAINRKELVQHVFNLGETPAMGILNKEIAVQDAPYFEDGNIALAREYFAKALEEMEMTADEFPPITLSQRTNLLTSRVSQVVQDQLRTGLGLKIEINQVDWPVHLSRVSKGDYQIGEMSWYSLLNDPIYMLDTFRDRHLSSNMCRWEHPHYQELLKKADYEVDLEKRKEYFREAEELLMDEMPIIPLCFNSQSYLKNKDLKGVYVSSLQEINFRYAYFLGEE